MDIAQMLSDLRANMRASNLDELRLGFDGADNDGDITGLTKDVFVKLLPVSARRAARLIADWALRESQLDWYSRRGAFGEVVIDQTKVWISFNQRCITTKYHEVTIEEP